MAKKTLLDDRFKYASERINHAEKRGCHIEVIFLCEAIMAEQLRFFLRSTGTRVRTSTSFDNIVSLASMQSKSAGVPPPDRGSSDDDLFKSVKAWSTDWRGLVTESLNFDRDVPHLDGPDWGLMELSMSGQFLVISIRQWYERAVK